MGFWPSFPSKAAGLSSKAMSEHEKFAVPHEIDEILDRLPPQVTLHVPDHILALWFPPGPANGVMEGRALAARLATPKVAPASSRITATAVRASSPRRYRRKIDPAKAPSTSCFTAEVKPGSCGCGR